jgi:ankyrin repeat protein
VVDITESTRTSEPVETPAPLSPRDEVLLQSVWDGDLETVKLLVKKGANVNSAEPKKNRTALMLAATRKNLDVVKFLQEKGADVNARDSDGQTALMYSCRQRYRDKSENAVAFFLLENGAEINLRSKKKGFTALMLAAGTGNEELVQKLLDKGADPTIKDNFGVTAEATAKRTGQASVVEMLSNSPAPDAHE